MNLETNMMLQDLQSIADKRNLTLDALTLYDVYSYQHKKYYTGSACHDTYAVQQVNCILETMITFYHGSRENNGR